MSLKTKCLIQRFHCFSKALEDWLRDCNHSEAGAVTLLRACSGDLTLI